VTTALPCRYVGIDLHRRRSVIATMDEDGKLLDCVKIDNGPLALVKAVTAHPGEIEVPLESTYGFYWAADVLAAEKIPVHLVHPLGLHWESRRVKNDEKDAAELANRLRRHDLPEAWIAPPEIRELRELSRYRLKLTAYRTSAKAQIHAVMAKEGILPELQDMFSPAGQRLLDQLPFSGAYAIRVESLRDLLELVDREIAMVEGHLARRLKGHKGYEALQALNGVGPIFAALFVAEIGDVTRFASARHLCSWAGLTPTHRESDSKVRRGHVTKQGSTYVRWAAVEAVARYHGGSPIAPTYERVVKRRGVMIARVAAARKLLSLVYYGLRDGEIRCLAEKEAS
jgi:transposase